MNKIVHGQYLYDNRSLHVVGLKPFLAALHELDPAFRKENQRLKDLITDLKFHKDPVGAGFGFAAHKYYDDGMSSLQRCSQWLLSNSHTSVEKVALLFR